MSTYLNQLTDEMKRCMKAGEKDRLLVVRSLIASIKQAEIDQQSELDEAAQLAVLDKALKQRRDSLQQFEEAGRQDLAEREAYEITVISDFMPQPLSAAEIEQLVTDAISQTQAASMQDMGKVMGIVRPVMQGRADMAQVSQLIKASLS